MKIQTRKAEKRYSQRIIFTNFNYTFDAGSSYAILGKNGTGKSTLLKILAGIILPSNGSVEWYLHNQTIQQNNIFKYFGFCAPYYQIPEEMTLLNFLYFHHQFKPFSIDIPTIISLLNMKNIQHQPMMQFSTGMKQRIKLAQAIFLQTPLLLLDEPTSNLDVQNINWYHEQISHFAKNKLIIIASNTPHEYDFCKQQICIENYAIQ